MGVRVKLERRNVTNVSLLFGLSLLIILVSCTFTTDPPFEKQPPETRISNVPLYGDTLFPRVKIICDGGDYDGYIIGYEYRVITYHLTTGDSVITPWEFVAEDSTHGVIEIIFESSDSLNKQLIQVRSVDNDSLVDPTPAELVLYTPRTIYPSVEITSPSNNSVLFFLDETNDWWQGIKINYSGFDEDGEVIEYAWSLDNGSFVWTTDTTIMLKPEDFVNGLEGKHNVKIICKDNTFLVDSVGATVTFTLVRAQFDRGILMIDDTEENNFPSSARKVFNDVVTDSMYKELFSPDTMVDYAEDGLPRKEVLGRYRLIIWHADNPGTRHHVYQHEDILRDYLNVGGKLLVIGWEVIKSFAYESNFPVTFDNGSFVKEYLHISKADAHQGLFGDFIAAYGLNNFPDVVVNDSLITSFPYNGKLRGIEVITEKGPFTEAIYTYLGEDLNSGLIAQPCGIRYLGTQFNVIVITFPMTFLKEDNKRLLANKLLEAIRYK